MHNKRCAVCQTCEPGRLLSAQLLDASAGKVLLPCAKLDAATRIAAVRMARAAPLHRVRLAQRQCACAGRHEACLMHSSRCTAAQACSPTMQVEPAANRLPAASCRLAGAGVQPNRVITHHHAKHAGHSTSLQTCQARKPAQEAGLQAAGEDLAELGRRSCVPKQQRVAQGHVEQAAGGAC